ncbi:MAG: zinc-ribbon domain-containing protein [Geobacteraceae bacterium]|nr:zinc-ribbon domain-containing protein [Geobacteraceae bacterium]
MSLLTVSCPSCGFSRQIPAEKVPEGPRRVTCPHCKEIFIFTKPVSLETATEASVTGDSGPSCSGSQGQPPPSSDSSPASPDFSPDADISSAADEEPPLPPAVTALTDIGELFRQSWELFQKRFATLVLLYLLTILAVFIPTAVATGLSLLLSGITGFMALFVVLPLGVVAGIVAALWCYGGFLCAVVDDTLTLENALSRGKAMILPLAWVFLLLGFVVTGGYLLFIIPGIFFTVWFFFAQFVLPGEGVRGMEALLKSREYVRGQWLNVALRLLLIWAVSMLVGAVPFFGPILSLIFFPYVMIFHYLIYRDLRALKGDVPYPCGTADKLRWPGVALLGWIIVPTVLFLLFGSLFCGKFRQSHTVEAMLPSGTSLERGVKIPADWRFSETGHGKMMFAFARQK